MDAHVHEYVHMVGQCNAVGKCKILDKFDFKSKIIINESKLALTESFADKLNCIGGRVVWRQNLTNKIGKRLKDYFYSFWTMFYGLPSDVLLICFPYSFELCVYRWPIAQLPAKGENTSKISIRLKNPLRTVHMIVNQGKN